MKSDGLKHLLFNYSFRKLFSKSLGNFVCFFSINFEFLFCTGFSQNFLFRRNTLVPSYFGNFRKDLMKKANKKKKRKRKNISKVYGISSY